MSAAPATLESEIANYANGLPYWATLLSQKILQGTTITDVEITEAYGYVLEDLGLAPKSSRPPFTIGSTTVAGGAYKKDVSLSKLSNVEGVNALSEGQTIQFSPNLTVVFGNNGCGKSGYTRLFKKAFYSKAPEDVRSNIYDTGTRKPVKGEFTFASSGAEHSLVFPDDAISAEFRQFAVFDGKSILKHLADRNQFEFRPAGLGYFGILTDCIKRLSHGTATISYTVTNAFGCSAIRTFDIEVLALPDSGIISGIDSVCLYGTTHLSETIPDGTWHSQDAGIAAVDASGNVSGVALGSTVISYTVFDGHCYNTATFTIRVVTVPSIPPIEGPDSICVIGSAELSDPLAGGTWSSYDPGMAVVDASGVVSGVTTGITTIAYSVSNDCGTTTVTKTIVIVPVEPPVFGPHAVCSGSTINLSSTVAGGTWTSDDETIAIVDETTGVVTGVSSGSTVITYSGESACGPYEVYFNISVNIAPYISTNVMVACQTLANDKTGPIIISGTSGCIKVCDSTTARYYANGVYGSMFTWIVTGGVIVNNYGDSIDVFWTPAGTTGSITLIDTFSHCIGTASACMQVISRPHAEFTASSTNVCLGNTVVFTNLSTADPSSPIVSYQWDFGDGTGSSDINPTHAYGASNINSVVTLIVKNACNCTDTSRLYLHIYGDSGVVISCPGIVCDSEIASYSIPADACVGSYAWNVVGGTIISGAGTDVIQVRWDNAYPTGFGYVSVVDACAACPDTSTIKIPVILHHAPITGPSTPCTGQEYIYSLPLWAATQYQWGVLGDPSVKVGFSNDYQLVVNFPTAGAYILHGWYQNSLKGCGGNVFDTIKVSNSDTMLGPATVCPLTPETYATASGTPISWVVSDVAGTIVGTGAGASFTYTFTAPGLYRISGNGDFCIQPLTVNVLAPPPAFDSVRGEDTVCLGRVYTYNSYSDVPGTICNWQAIGGTVTPSSGSNTVNVRWNTGGTMYLIATRQSMTAPYCSSAPDTLVVIQDSVKLFAKHYDTVCANSHGGVSTIYTRAEWYQWSIIPETRGSITSGLHDMVANILWNDVPGTVPATADVVLTVHKCDSVFTDTVHITILPTPRITITASPQPACPRYPVTLTTTAGGSSYLWNFSDGSPAETTTTNTVTHEFPRNFTSSNTSYP